VLVMADDDRVLVGILTDRDIVVRALAEGRDPAQTRVGDVCSRQVITVGPEDSVGHAVRVMREKAIRRIPVVDGSQVVGMLTLGDIAVKRDSRTALADISAAPPST
jgi:CBS domain-containing protein